MAQNKSKAAYFPHYCTMSKDQGIRMLDIYFRRKLGLPKGIRFGYQVYASLLEYAAAQNSDSIRFDDELRIEAVAEDIQVDSEILCELVEKAIEFDLFDSDIFNTFGNLSSNRMYEVRKMIDGKKAAGSAGGNARVKNAAENVEQAES